MARYPEGILHRMFASILAVLAALAGAALTSADHAWTDRRGRTERQRARVTDATAQLLDAVVSYRELYWLLIADIRAGDQETREARAARYRARSEITKARDRIALATTDPALLAAAEEASWSAIELADIDTGTPRNGHFTPTVEAALTAARERSRDAHTALRRAGTAYAHAHDHRTPLTRLLTRGR